MKEKVEAFKYRVKIEMEINLVRDVDVQQRSFHGRKRSVHVRKLNKKVEETYERETFYVLTKKSRKLKEWKNRM